MSQDDVPTEPSPLLQTSHTTPEPLDTSEPMTLDNSTHNSDTNHSPSPGATQTFTPTSHDPALTSSDSGEERDNGTTPPRAKLRGSVTLCDHCYSPSSPSCVSPILKKPRSTRPQDNTALSAAIPPFRLAYAPAVPTSSLMLQRLLQLNPARPSPLPAPRGIFSSDRAHLSRISPRPNPRALFPKRPLISASSFYPQAARDLTHGNRPLSRGVKRKGKGAPLLLPSKRPLKRKLDSPGVSTDTDEESNPLLCRRSDRNIGKNQRYRYEVDLNLSDEGSEDGSRPSKKKESALARPSELFPQKPTLMTNSGELFEQWPSEEEYVIDKVLSNRTMDAEEDTEQFYVKFKGYSYLHSKWSTLSLLNQADKRAVQKINRYRQRQADLAALEEEPFNPDYIQVDRILDMDRVREMGGGVSVYYLVKWCSLSYEEATWELKDNILDEHKVRLYEQLNRPPPLSALSQKPRPSSEVPVSNTHKEYKNNNYLRAYQQVGLNWLVMKWFSRKNCILADEMGLGKTIQTIAFLKTVLDYGIRGPFLIIAPLSTIQNWYREFQSWTDMNVIVYHGTLTSRKLIEEYEFYFKTLGDRKGLFKFNCVITTYEAVLIEGGELINIPWRVTVIDEGHRLKNTRGKLTSHLKAFDMEHKILLTGTPLQNSVEELWSLLNFLEPLKFDSEEEFLAKFGQLQSESQVVDLQKVLKPMMLRRLKEDVEKNLAPKEETIIEVELTSIQKKYYRAIMEKNFSFIVAKATARNVPNLMNLFMELRKCCNHPFLIKGAETHITEDWQKFHPSEPAWRSLVQASGKLVLVDKLLPKLREGNHKVLVFSQMVKCLDILEDYLLAMGYPYERIDGQIRGNLRQAAIDRFSKPGSDRFVFLLCTRAGGLGINLTAADTVIIYDSDWNPQNDLQAQARCHRIGQDKPVKVYRLLTRNSYERQMFDKASKKLGLDKAVLQSVNNGESEGSAQLSKAEVEQLLRLGAYGAILDEDETAAKFCNEDIEDILKRRTRVVTIDTLGNNNSTFAKASFVSSEGDSEISMEDPDFWQKWALKAEVDLAKLEKKEGLILNEPRERRQTKRFEIQDPSFDAAALEPDSNTSTGEEEEEDVPPETEALCPLYRGVCMKIEQALMTYGWGRWSMMLRHTDLKHSFQARDLELICRKILVFSLHHFRGDDKVKSTISSFLDPGQQGEEAQCGREELEQMLSQPPDSLFSDSAYKRHLQRVSGRVLQRVRVLHHIKTYIIAENYDRLMSGDLTAEQFDADLPEIDNPPAAWWGPTADRSLILGTIKHGYENYHLMAEDTCLQMAPPAGLPPGSEAPPAPSEPEDSLMDPSDGEEAASRPARDWPSASELNNRLKKMVTESDRNLKKIIIRSERRALKAKKQEQRRENKRRLSGSDRPSSRHPSVWSIREEHDFAKALYSHGVLWDSQTGKHDWARARVQAKLRKKEQQIETFYREYVAMCHSVIAGHEGSPGRGQTVTPVKEERAHKFIKRLQLLSLVRETLAEGGVEERLQLAERSAEVPAWWQVPTHDLDLLRGVAKHGMTRSDLKIYLDPEFSFSQTAPNSTSLQREISGKKLAQTLPSNWPSYKHIFRRITRLVHLLKKAFWSKPLPLLPRLELDLSLYGPHAHFQEVNNNTNTSTEALELIVRIPFDRGGTADSSDSDSSSSSGSSNSSQSDFSSDNSDTSDTEGQELVSPLCPLPSPGSLADQPEAMLISIPLINLEKSNS